MIPVLKELNERTISIEEILEAVNEIKQESIQVTLGSRGMTVEACATIHGG